MAISSVAAGARPAMPRRGLFVLGLLMALLAFVAVFGIGIALSGRASTSGRQVPIVVAARDIQAREVIAPGALVLVQYPEAQVPPGALTALAQAKGQAAQVRILKGQPLTANLISASGEPIESVSSYLPIPQGFVAVTLPTGEQQGVAGYIAAGDYINVLATVSTSTFGATPSKTVTKTVFTDLHVIRVGPAPATGGQPAQKQGLSSSITVVVTACDAQYLSWLVANASVRYLLLSYKDYLPAPAAADPACPATVAPAGIGPNQVEARYAFTRI